MTIKVKNKEYNLTKWKAKVKKEFLNTMLGSKDIDTLQDVLVYNNIIEPACFNSEEFKYVLSQLRILSLGKDLDLQFYCEGCKQKFIKTIDLNEILRPEFGNGNTIKTKNYIIQIGDIKNAEFYKKTILENPEESRELDLFLRIETINADNNFTLDDVIEMFNEMDIDEYDSIFNQWEELRFKINDVYDVKCECGHSQKYKFDEIPGFFPKDWFKK